MPSETADLAIVGAGAAGLMAAIAAARSKKPGPKILLFDSRNKIGAKILISGGTRCNVTNVRVTPSDYEGGPSHFVKHVLEAFTPDETKEFFRELGVELILEPTGKYFPTTHSGKTVLDALLNEIKKQEVSLKTGIRITEIKKTEKLFYLKGCPLSGTESNWECAAKRVILATGGLSYPETGSDGTGLQIAKNLGHTINRTSPALTPLTTDDADWTSLTGIALEAGLSFFKNDKKEAERKGSFLFTHFGFSGPAALDISRFLAAAEPKEKPQIVASFLPLETQGSLEKSFEALAMKHPEKMIKSFLIESAGLSSRFVDIFLKKAEIDGTQLLKKCSKNIRNRLLHTLLNCPLKITGVVGYKKAEVTAGGVKLKEIKYSTMESKIVPGLYFTGETLDIDGRIGGFNFQWAWSTGAIAGRSAAKSLQSP